MNAWRRTALNSALISGVVGLLGGTMSVPVYADTPGRSRSW